ncbi:MAG: division/cell wall cluster transcriptional repressor MraZ [Cryomorphaceae bacterium]|nr:division/cell wall cluster transcriptional repressor MraZ [Cryomorphaceae bacterium]
MPKLNLIGVHECKPDAKSRIALPASLKRQLQPFLSEGFVMKRSVFQQCLELFPMQEWNEVMDKLNTLNRFVKKNADFIRMYTAGVKTLEVDGSGRLLIPKDLAQYAGIEQEIILSATGRVIEIWDKVKYENAIDDASVDFGALAEDVMGQFGSDGHTTIS